MMLASIASSVSAALPQLSTHSHGHKKGVHSATGSSNDTAQSASGTTQSLFGNLLQSLEEVIGVTSPTTSASTSSLTTPSSAPVNSQTQSAATQLQKYLKHAPQNLLNTNVNIDSKA
jgi:hypothetical protein